MLSMLHAYCHINNLLEYLNFYSGHIMPKNVFRTLSNVNLKLKSVAFSHGNTHITNVLYELFNNCQNDSVTYAIVITTEMA